MNINEAIFEVITTPCTDETSETEAFKIVRDYGYIIGIVTLHPDLSDNYVRVYGIESRKTNKSLWAYYYRIDEHNNHYSILGSRIFNVDEYIGRPVRFDFVGYLDTPEKPYIDSEERKPTIDKYNKLQRAKRQLQNAQKRLEQANEELQDAKQAVRFAKQEIKEYEKQLIKLRKDYNLS